MEAQSVNLQCFFPFTVISVGELYFCTTKHSCVWWIRMETYFPLTCAIAIIMRLCAEFVTLIYGKPKAVKYNHQTIVQEL